MDTERGPADQAPADQAPGTKNLSITIIPIAALLLLAIVVAVMAFGGNRRSTSTACGEVVVEQIDPQSVLHLLPTSPEPPYLSDPPTSGPHVMGPPVQGALDEVLPRPIQTGILERGAVLVQYRPDLPYTERDELNRLGGQDVVIAPNPVVENVVATAWGRRLTCSGVDITSLEQFISAFAGRGSQMAGGS